MQFFGETCMERLVLPVLEMIKIKAGHNRRKQGVFKFYITLKGRDNRNRTI